MTQTKQEIRQKWNKENLALYGVSFHRKYDADIIEYVEGEKKKGIKTTDIFRNAIRKLIK